MNKMLPFQPETATEAKARWHRAVARLWEWDCFDPVAELEQLLTGRYDRPGLYRENVFDFHDGLRLIVSDDLYRLSGREERYLHVSASLRDRVQRKFAPRTKPFDAAGFASFVHDRVLFLSGRHVTLGYSHGQPRWPFNVAHCFDPPLPPELREAAQ